MIKQSDEVKYLNDVSANIRLCLATSKDNIQTSTKLFEKKSVGPLHSAIYAVLNRVEGFAKTKQANTIKEHLINSQLIEELHRDNEANKRLAQKQSEM